MQQLKKFTQEGNIYRLNRQYGLIVPLVGFFILLSFIGFAYSPESSFKWWMLGIALLCGVSFMVSSLAIDMDKKEIIARMGLIGSTKTVPLSDLQGFTIHKLKQMGFITTNVTLTAQYIKNGREREIRLVQSFFTRPIQNILNDIDEILESHDQR